MPEIDYFGEKEFCESERYNMKNFLGAGAAGEVYKVGDNTAEKITLIRDFAYKDHISPKVSRLHDVRYLGGHILQVDDNLLQLTDDELKRFRESLYEANMLREADARNVVRLNEHKYVECRGDIYSVIEMEFVKGDSLHDATISNLEDKLKALRDVADAISDIHKQKIIHRDVKPANIIYTKDKVPGEGKATLIDFSLATRGYGSIKHEYAQLLTNESILRSRLSAGTLGYIAPEVVRSRMMSPMNDIFSFGLVAYKVLMQKEPFSGDEETALRQIRDYCDIDKEIFMSRMWKSGFSHSLSEAWGQMMSEDPDEREINSFYGELVN